MYYCYVSQRYIQNNSVSNYYLSIECEVTVILFYYTDILFTIDPVNHLSHLALFRVYNLRAGQSILNLVVDLLAIAEVTPNKIHYFQKNERSRCKINRLLSVDIFKLDFVMEVSEWILSNNCSKSHPCIFDHLIANKINYLKSKYLIVLVSLVAQSALDLLGFVFHIFDAVSSYFQTISLSSIWSARFHLVITTTLLMNINFLGATSHIEFST